MKAYILAGGKSSRMGEDKGLKLLHKKPIISYLIDTLQKAKLDVVIISNKPEYDQFGLEVVPDIIKEKGPLGGIHAALNHSTDEKFLVFSCDTPFIPLLFIDKLINNNTTSDISVLEIDSKIQPLMGMYSKKIKNSLAANIAQNRLRITQFIKDNNATFVSIQSDEKVLNINTPEDFIEAKNNIQHEN